MFNKFVENLRAQLNAKRQENALISLSDRALEDIGLTRGEVVALQTVSKSTRNARSLPNTSASPAQRTVLAHAA